MMGNDAGLDRRTITQLMLDQIEFANVIVVSKASVFLSTGSEEQLGNIKNLLQKLNPKAHIIVPLVDKYGDLDVEKELLSTGLFDMESAQSSTEWTLELAKHAQGARVPETEEYGISSVIFRAAAMPFHPERISKILDGFGDYGSAMAAGAPPDACGGVYKPVTCGEASRAFLYVCVCVSIVCDTMS